VSDPQSPDLLPGAADLGLRGKVAIVTGGGAPDNGIGKGRAAAMLLARRRPRAGRRYPARGRRANRGDDRSGGGTVAPFVADVVDEVQCRALVDEALARFGRLDLLDNNVGIGGRGSVVDTAVADWRRIMQVNVDSMFLVSRFAIPAMTRTAGGGAIVNVSSISALRPRGLTAYSARFSVSKSPATPAPATTTRNPRSAITPHRTDPSFL
jgi:NAD(P)-dependent dehydrogenase (short-subunit alcohol dehydrogenase family)